MTRCEIRTATAKDAFSFYGKAPINSFKGIVAVENDKVIGIGGLFYSQSNLVVFTDMKPEMRQYKKAIVKGCRIIMDMVKNADRPVYAMANPDEPTAERLLEKLGFVHTGLKNELGETLVWGDT